MNKGVGLFGLIGIVVGACIGTGVFAMTGQIAGVASPGGALIAFAIVGVGFTCLALSLANLGTKRADLTGVYSYASEGFGPLAGFISGWGYWLSAWLGNVAYATLICQTIGYFYPPWSFDGGIPIPCLIFASVVMWGITGLVIRGIESASFVNACVMVAKILGIVVFILFAAMSFNAGILTEDFWGNVYNNYVASGQAGEDAVGLGGLPEQVIGCFVIIMWAFIGIEGATVLSSRAREKRHVSKATILGLLILLVTYLCMAIIPYGVMPYTEVATLSYPAATYVFEQIMPGFGGGFLSVVIIFSIIGAWLSFTILPVETAQEMAEDKLLPEYWGKLNKFKSPFIGLIIVGICTQVIMATLIVSEDAYNFAFSMCTVAIVFTWTLAAAYNLKYSLNKKSYGQVAIAAVAVIFFVIGTILNGWDLLMLTCIGYLPGFVLYSMALKKQGKSLTSGEIVTIVIFAIIAAGAFVLLGMGIITI